MIRNRANRPIWSSESAGNAGAVLYLQRDGNVVFKRPGRRVVWATGTNE